MIKAQEELRNRYNPDGSDLRKAQLRMLEMLVYIDKICKANNIEYWLDYGTLLGAARHNGYIPWDDDTDICMPRKEYKRFKRILLSNPHQQFVLQDHTTDPNYYGFWGVLRDLKSEYIQNSNLHKIRKYRGLQVDIFLVDNDIIGTLHYISRVISGINIRILNKKINKLNLFLVNFIFHFQRDVINPIFRMVSKCKIYKSEYVPSYGGLVLHKRKIEDIYPLSTIEFEGNQFNSPHDPDKYLIFRYGNYMQIPDEKDRVTHKVSVAFK
jgi:lipopolysaccharide cholinephosphotransferase